MKVFWILNTIFALFIVFLHRNDEGWNFFSVLALINILICLYMIIDLFVPKITKVK